MKKKILGLASAVILSSSLLVAIPVLGDESTDSNQTLESINSAIIERNLDIERLEKELEMADNKYDLAKENEGKGSSPMAADMAKEYDIVNAKMNFDYTTWSLEETEQAKTLEGIRLYYTYNYQLDEIALQESKIARLETLLDEVNKKIELGTASVNSRATAQLQVSIAENDLQTLLANNSKTLMDLNKLMNYKLDTQFILKDKNLKIEEFVVKDIDSDIGNVLMSDGNLMKIAVGKDLTNIKYNIDNRYSGGSGSDKTASINLEDAIIKYDQDYKDKKLNLEYDVRSKYNEVLNNYDSYKIKSLELENLQITLDTAKKRQELGLETTGTVKLAQENVDSATIALNKAKLAYYISVEGYKNMVD